MVDNEAFNPMHHRPQEKTNAQQANFGFVYEPTGIPLKAKPDHRAMVLDVVPLGACVQFDEATSIKEKVKNLSGHWQLIEFKTQKGYVFDGFTTPFALPEEEESYEVYAERLQKQGFDVKFETYRWDDRIEYKFLLPTTKMQDAFWVASTLYPMTTFPFPAPSHNLEEFQSKIDEENDLIEEMTITRNEMGEVIHIEYIADFNDSSDVVTLQSQTDGFVLVVFANYINPDGDSNGISG